MDSALHFITGEKYSKANPIKHSVFVLLLLAAE